MSYKNYVGSMGAAFEPWLAADRLVTPPDYALVLNAADRGAVLFSFPRSRTGPWCNARKWQVAFDLLTIKARRWRR